MLCDPTCKAHGEESQKFFANCQESKEKNTEQCTACGINNWGGGPLSAKHFLFMCVCVCVCVLLSVVYFLL